MQFACYSKVHVTRDIVADGFRACLHSKYIAPASKNAPGFLHDNLGFSPTQNQCYPLDQLLNSQMSRNASKQLGFCSLLGFA